ncbi:probable 39S ribosomal protein L23, mitochondrial [Cephus cinctus]|uniref:Large ribosomal subunit protein uL23m n=1 Tax=Cephus cinctus TaxID=211228 RepID=A0AAJ7BYN3_CEPCN|nr:probable 39S ribosomal protein L23, mitochondrial [Cephus cinctus]
MSTRWYPVYQKGNPQLRVFLPNFWLKIVNPTMKQPKNVVQFHCSMEMTVLDVKQYLKKIYDVHPVQVNTRIQLGKIRPEPYKSILTKEEDVKVAYVVLPKDQTFEYPPLFEKDDTKDKNVTDDMAALEEAKKGFKAFIKRNKVPGTPGWFA